MGVPSSTPPCVAPLLTQDLAIVKTCPSFYALVSTIFFFFFFFKNFLGQFELSTKLQFPSKLVELKWWCSTTLGTPFFFFFFLKNFFLGEPFHEQARYISDIEEIDMAAIIELMGLDVSRMDQQPPKGIFYILFF